MITMLSRGAISATALLALAFGAQAHTTLETQQAPVSSTYKAVLRVGHGCEGAPTLKLRVQHSGGRHQRQAHAQAGLGDGNRQGPLREDLRLLRNRDVRGRAGDRLDGQAARRALRRVCLPSLPDRTASSRTPCSTSPLVQECEGGKADRWIEIPAEGKSADDYEHPAPGLKLLPAKATH